MPTQAQDCRVSSSPSVVFAFGFRPKRSRRIVLTERIELPLIWIEQERAVGIS